LCGGFCFKEGISAISSPFLLICSGKIKRNESRLSNDITLPEDKNKVVNHCN